MTKKDLIIEVARQLGSSKKDASKYIDAVLEGIKIGIERDHEVALDTFGVFYVQTRAARNVRHPGTGEMMDVPQKKYPRIRFSKAVKKLVEK